MARTDVEESQTERSSDSRDAVVVATDEEFAAAFAVEKARWASLAERLK
jgi:hypothetical protein